jgi:hypothetical protein
MAIFPRLFWRWDGSRFTTVEEMQELLGLPKVYEASSVFTAWGDKFKLTPPVLYPISVARQCAQANKKKKADYRLVYYCGRSLRQMHKVRGTDPRQQPCFYDGNSLWSRKQEIFWTDVGAESGYYLINFQPRFRNFLSTTQDLKLSELGEVYAALPECVFAETVFSIFMLTGERLLERDIHSGPSIDSYGNHVKIGYNDSNGLSVSSFDYARKDSGMVTFIRPHVPAL